MPGLVKVSRHHRHHHHLFIIIFEWTRCSNAGASSSLPLGSSLWKVEFLMRQSQQQWTVESEERKLAGLKGGLPSPAEPLLPSLA